MDVIPGRGLLQDAQGNEEPPKGAVTEIQLTC